MKHSIELISLTKYYPKLKGYKDIIFHPFKKRYLTALLNVNLTVEEGSIYGLLGPNGAGKTTLIKILSTLVLPTSGRAFVNGYDVVQQQRQVRMSIGLVVNDERSFYWRLTGRQNLSFFADLNNLSGTEKDKRIIEVLRITEMEKDADRVFSDYSTGMKQRIAIARGLLCDPSIILLDEPTRSLDPLSAKHLRKFIKDEIIYRHNRTAFVATNNLREAEDLCTHIAIIQNGTITLCGPIEKIKQQLNAANIYLVKLARHSQFTDISSLQNVLSVNKASDDPNVFYIESPDISQLITDIVQHNGAVEECSLKTISLDEVFLKAVGKTPLT
jgi:ABC-2 type transport system ATP-binding protein